MIILKGSGTTHHTSYTRHSHKKKLVEKEIQQKKAKYASIKQGKAKACTKLSNNFLGGRGGGNLQFFVYRETPPKVQPLALLYTIFHEKGTPLRGSPPKSGRLDFATKNSFPLFFVGEEALVGIY